ncbi:hypothetical protein BH18ACT1_BH18ACT1_02560 [soil metagenome]
MDLEFSTSDPPFSMLTAAPSRVALSSTKNPVISRFTSVNPAVPSVSTTVSISAHVFWMEVPTPPWRVRAWGAVWVSGPAAQKSMTWLAPAGSWMVSACPLALAQMSASLREFCPLAEVSSTVVVTVMVWAEAGPVGTRKAVSSTAANPSARRSRMTTPFSAPAHGRAAMAAVPGSSQAG